MNCLSASKKWLDFINENFKDVRQPFSAGIELHPDCNFRCVHCYIESDRQQKSKRRQLSVSDFKHIIDELEKRNCIELFFTGGEALLYPGFEEIYIYAKRKGILVSVLTNGSLIDDSHIRLWLKYPPELISITLYGATEASYLNVTCNKNGFNNVLRAIDKLQKNKIPFEIKCIGMEQNKNDVLKIREISRTLGHRNTTLAWDIRPMNDGNAKPITCRLSAQEAFAIELQDSERKYFYDSLKDNPIRHQPTQRQKEGFLYPCSIAYQFVYITSDGYMQGCVKAVNPRYDLLNGNFDEGWEFLGTEFVYKKASAAFPCTRCDKFRYCGQCTAAFVDENKNPEEPVRFYCELGELRKKYMDS